MDLESANNSPTSPSRPFSDRDLEQWRKSLSGEGLTFAVPRSELEALFERLEAAEDLLNYHRCKGDSGPCDKFKRWRQACNK